MKKLKVMLVDDELSSLQNLHHKLTEFCPDVEVVAQTQKPEEAIELLRKHQPDLLFLDIEMPRMNGFRMLQELGEYDFEIIFTTAYNHYAIDAIRISAFDYLTKPIAIKDLQDAVERMANSHLGKTKEKIEVLTTAMNNPKSQKEKMAIPTVDGIELVPIETIIHLESSSSYTKIYFTDERMQLVAKSLGEYEGILKDYRFFRIHHSHLINLQFVKRFIRGEGGQVVLTNGATLDISRRKKEEFLKLIAANG
jgi:two-component system, LytTR family, response regulator